METRSKRKKKEANAIPPPPPVSPSSTVDFSSSSSSSSSYSSSSSSSSDFRNWSDLPQDLLLPILDRLSLSIPDLLSFAAVCRSWRSAAASALASSPFSGPPLLLTPVLTRHRRPLWAGPPRCRLQTLTNNPRSYRPIITSKTLRAKCVGCCYGHLIFDAGDKAVLVNVFTGDKIQSPKFPERPSSPPYAFRTGVLTAPPSSPDCCLLLVAPSCTLFWRLDGIVWAREEYLRYGQEVKSVAFFNGKLYCLDDKYRVKVVDYDFPASWTTLELRLPNAPSLHGNFGKYLVECGGEILLVLFAGIAEYKCQIDVYRLDFERVKWEKKENLGDRCLFVDVAGNCPIVCSKPASWGGRSNCVYVAGPGHDNWSVHPVDGSRIDALDRGTALSLAYKKFSRWPSPIWIYPSKLL